MASSVPELLLETLLEFEDNQLKTFQYYLYSNVLQGLPHVPKSRAKGANYPDTAELLAQTYGYSGAVTVTVDILMKMKCRLLAERLKEKYDKGKSM